MSNPNPKLIAEIQVTDNVIPLMHVLEFNTDIKRLLGLKVFKEAKPRLSSTYRHLESLPKELLDPEDVKRFKEFMIKHAMLVTSPTEKTVISARCYQSLEPDARKAIQKNKQAIITSSDGGCEYYQEMLKVERAFSMLVRRMEKFPVFHMYNIYRLYQIMLKARQAYYMYDSPLFTYIQTLMTLIDVLGNDRELIASTTRLSHKRKITGGDICGMSALNELNGLAIAMRVANREYGNPCIFTDEELKDRGVSELVIEFINSFKNEMSSK